MLTRKVLFTRVLTGLLSEIMSKREADEVIGDAEKKTFVEEAAADNGSHAMNEDAKTADVAAETALANRATLYHKPHYSSAPNTVVIHELGIKDKVNVVACKGDEHKTGDLAAHNPHGFVRATLLPLPITFSSTLTSFYAKDGAIPAVWAPNLATFNSSNRRLTHIDTHRHFPRHHFSSWDSKLTEAPLHLILTLPCLNIST